MARTMQKLVLAVGALLASETTLAAATEAVWFNGKAEAAFAKAKAEKKPVLLVWSAVWCPPCNDLKAQVFSKPRFAELMQPMIPVYLDGDTEDAQIWSEKLAVTGYPTVVLYNAEAQESMRFTLAMTMEEFETALTAGLAAGGDLQRVIARAAEGKATTDDWRMLAYVSWSQSHVFDNKPDGGITSLTQLAKLAPAEMVEAKALLAAAALEAAAGAGDEPARKIAADDVKKEAKGLLEAVLINDKSVRAARLFVANAADQTVAWVEPTAGEARDALAERWIKAASTLETDPSLSIDARLSAVGPAIFLFKLRAKDKAKAPAELVAKVQKAAAKADADAKTAYERKATIPTAAWLLQEIGDFDGARALLEKELKTTDTPWYYESTYAGVEKAAGREVYALGWAEKARKSAIGRATRVQWIVEDLVLSSKVKTPTQDARMRELVKDYYSTALALPDGFSGRNAARAKRVAESVRPFVGKDQELRKLVEGYVAQCGKLDGKAAAAELCAKHFAGLLTGV